MSAGRLLKQANQLKRQGKLDEAIALYHQVIEINPNFAWAYHNLGDTLVKRGNLDEAVTYYVQSLKINQNSPWLLWCLGEALAKQGYLEDATQYLRKAIEIKPNFYKFYNSLGQVLNIQGDFDEAIAIYNQSIKLNPEVDHSYVGCCLSYMCKGELSHAQQYLHTAIKLFPQNEQARLYYDFFEIMDKLTVKINSDSPKDIINFSENFPNQKQTDFNHNQYFSKILNLVKVYEKVFEDKNLKFPKLEKFHLCISEVTLPGMDYLEILMNLHILLEPMNYVEIGVQTGKSFKLASSSTISVGIDPNPQLKYRIPSCAKIFPVTSDEFFKNYDLLTELEGYKVDFAFIDGLHLFEQTLKDFINLEKYSTKNTVVCFHDTLPLDEITSRRNHETRFWSGDVWKIVSILKKYRPDLKIFTVATKPTGLTIVTNLDSHSKILSTNYDDIVHEYLEEDWIESIELRYALLSVVSNNWKDITKRLKSSND